MPRPQAEALRVVQRLHGREDPVEVQQRLAHAHEHDVGQPLAVRREPASGVAGLVDDLGRLEVAPEAELARGTERTAHGAAGLAREAQRVPLPRRAAGRVVHQDGLDELAVIESMEGLLGQPAIRDPKLGVVDRIEAEVALQRRAQWSPAGCGSPPGR